MGKSSRIANRAKRGPRRATQFDCGWCPGVTFPVRLTWNHARQDWAEHNLRVHNHRLHLLKGDGWQELVCDNPPRGQLVTH